VAPAACRGGSRSRCATPRTPVWLRADTAAKTGSRCGVAMRRACSGTSSDRPLGCNLRRSPVAPRWIKLAAAGRGSAVEAAKCSEAQETPSW
jgi:hypothetical protein